MDDNESYLVTGYEVTRDGSVYTAATKSVMEERIYCWPNKSGEPISQILRKEAIYPRKPNEEISESPYYYLLDAADSGFSFIDLRPPRLKNDNKTVEKSLKSSSFTQTFIIFLSSPKYHE